MTPRITHYKLDGKVIETMLLVSALFLIIMAFRFKNTAPCHQVDFGFRTANRFDVAYEKERVYFSSKIKYDANSWEWDFGDKTPHDTKSGPYTTHEYAQPGQYTVRLIINGKCQEAKNISIVKRNDGERKLYLRPVWPPEKLVAGRDYYFGDSTAGAVSWNWYFGKDDTRRNRQNIRYQFVEPGEYLVTLVINDDVEFGRAVKKFTVVPPPKINAPVIDDYSRNNRGGGGGRGQNNLRPVGDIPENPSNTGESPGSGKSLEEMIRDASKLPNVGEAALKAYILDINGDGAQKLKDHLRNRSFANCNILFNGRSITLDELRANMQVHNQYGKSLRVTRETDARDNAIKVMEITAELEARDRWIGKPKARKYPY
jgi:hypothetical protein